MIAITKGEKIKITNVRTSAKTLGFFISPSLRWKYELEDANQKIKSSIKS